MREKYETLSVAVLKDIAKARGLKGVTGLKKAELIDRMVEEDAKLEGQNEQAAEPEKEEEKETEKEQKNKPEQQTSNHAREAARNRRQENTENGRENGNGNNNASSNSNNNSNTGNNNSNSNNNSSIGNNNNNNSNSNSNSNTGSSNSNGNNNTGNSSGNNIGNNNGNNNNNGRDEINSDLDSGVTADGILEVMPDGYGFIRCENYLPGEHDVYVSPSQIRRFGLKTGDIVRGNTRIKTQGEKFSALLYITTINGYHPSVVAQRRNFEDLTPIFPNERLKLETSRSIMSMRIVDLVSPIGKGQRGMIVSPPKAGKTTLLKQVAKAIKQNNPEIHLIILLIDERPEEVTDIKEAIEGKNVEVIYSTFDELPEHHKRVSEMVIERAKRLVEHKRDVMILLDSITRLARAYNLTVPPSGRTLSGGLDPAALHMPKRFFGAARNMREGGSLTILATALVDTGSKMDDVVYEEFKGTGNMELVLDRKLSEKRVFPAIDIVKSGTRREDLLLDKEEQEAVDIMRKGINGMKTDDAVENILNMFSHTSNNRDYIQLIKKRRV